MIAAVTNIDADHLETYAHDFKKLRAAFVEFLHRLPFYGLAVMCIDDPVVRELLTDVGRPVITYGFSDDADLHACDVRPKGSGAHFTVCFDGDQPEARTEEFPHNLPGEHNSTKPLAAEPHAHENRDGKRT